MRHGVVFRSPGRFAGWPANYGMWAWGDEVVLCFTVGHMRVNDELFHLRDTGKPFVTMQARSRDGGVTWDTGPFPGRTPGGAALSADEHMDDELGLAAALASPDCTHRPTPHAGGIDFTAPDFALMGARAGRIQNPGNVSMFYTSTDRCRTWDGPFELPMFGQLGVAARTAYLPLDKHDCLLFLSGAKRDGSEGRTFCARTRDGGAGFEFVSYIGDCHDGRQGWTIMPACVAVPTGDILVALRCGVPVGNGKPWRHWVELHRSSDEGSTWSLVPGCQADTGINGNPPTLNALPDGRLCLVYGYRDEPQGIRARLSEDHGQTWGDEICLRGDGATPDCGYPRTVVLRDGTIVTAYYYADRFDGERYIACTRWKP